MSKTLTEEQAEILCFVSGGHNLLITEIKEIKKYVTGLHDSYYAQLCILCL